MNGSVIFPRNPRHIDTACGTQEHPQHPSEGTQTVCLFQAFRLRSWVACTVPSCSLSFSITVVPLASHHANPVAPRPQIRNQVLNEALSRLTSSEPYPADAGTAGSLSATSTASAGGGTAGFPSIPRLMDRGRELAASLGGDCMCREYLDSIHTHC